MIKTLIPSLLVTAAISANGASIHTGLLNYWAMDGNANDTGSSFAEATGATTNNGSVNGTVSFTAGRTGFGTAATFPGGGGNNITVPDGTVGTNDIDRSGANLSISVWFKLTNIDGIWQAIIAHGEQSDYRIAYRNGTNPIQYAYAGGSVDIQSTTGYGAFTGGDSLWHHLVATTANGGATKLYIDGILEATGAGPSTIAASNANNNVLCIGCNPDNGREWNGQIDDVGMWDRVLSASDVTEIYNAGLNGIALGAIPEPSGAALIAFAGLVLLPLRRR